MNNYLLMLFVIFCNSCSMISKSNKDSKVVFDSANTPLWISEVEKACDQQSFLCASGSASSFEEADLRAKSALASIFETNISSKLSIYSSEFSDQERSRLQEQIISEVETSTDQVLKTVEIFKRHNQNEIYFSLARLDKRKNIKHYHKLINDIDQELIELFMRAKRTNLKRIMILFEKREHYNSRYLVLKGESIPTRYSIEDLEKLKRDSPSSVIKLDFNKELPEYLINHFKSLMSQIGLQIIESGDTFDYNVIIDFNLKEEFLNVQGFKKYSIKLLVKSQDQNDLNLGYFNILMTTSGRNKKDSLLRIRNNILEEIDDKIIKLNLK